MRAMCWDSTAFRSPRRKVCLPGLSERTRSRRRASLQLRLQETVEGRSVAAITYYLVGLTGCAARGVSAAGWPLDAELVMGLSIPVVAVIAALGIRYLRRTIVRSQGG